jgi:hypothetical protein
VVVVLVHVLRVLGLVVADRSERRALVELVLEVEGALERPEAGPYRASAQGVLVMIHLHATTIVLELGRGEREPGVGSRVEGRHFGDGLDEEPLGNRWRTGRRGTVHRFYRQLGGAASPEVKNLRLDS